MSLPLLLLEAVIATSLQQRSDIRRLSRVIQFQKPRHAERPQLRHDINEIAAKVDKSINHLTPPSPLAKFQYFASYCMHTTNNCYNCFQCYRCSQVPYQFVLSHSCSLNHHHTHAIP